MRRILSRTKSDGTAEGNPPDTAPTDEKAAAVTREKDDTASREDGAGNTPGPGTRQRRRSLTSTNSDGPAEGSSTAPTDEKADVTSEQNDAADGARAAAAPEGRPPTGRSAAAGKDAAVGKKN